MLRRAGAVASPNGYLGLNGFRADRLGVGVRAYARPELVQSFLQALVEIRRNLTGLSAIADVTTLREPHVVYIRLPCTLRAIF